MKWLEILFELAGTVLLLPSAVLLDIAAIIRRIDMKRNDRT